MNLLLLPGNSPEHKAWIREIERFLRPNFAHTAVIEYDNWLPGASNSIADLNMEAEKVREVVIGWEDYFVFAKSIGVALAIKSINDRIITPRKCMFVGTPVLWTRQNHLDLDHWIKGFKTPTLFIQQESDPCMPSPQLKQFLVEKNVANYSYVEVKGDDHNYEASSTVNLAQKFYF
jgi:hypothetical protein